MAALRGALAALTGCLLLSGSFDGLNSAMAQDQPQPTPNAAMDEAEAPDQVATGAGDQVRSFAVTAAAGLAELYDSNAQGLPNGSSDSNT